MSGGLRVRVHAIERRVFDDDFKSVVVVSEFVSDLESPCGTAVFDDAERLFEKLHLSARARWFHDEKHALAVFEARGRLKDAVIADRTEEIVTERGGPIGGHGLACGRGEV
jgi:hypothetical protein